MRDTRASQRARVACDEPIELVRDLVTRDRHEQVTATRLPRSSKGVLGALAELQLEDIVATRRQVQERHGRVIRAAAPRVAHRHRRKGRIVSHTAGHEVRRQTIKEGMHSLHGRRIEVESVGDEDTMGVKEVAARCVTHEGTLRVGIVQQEQPTKLVEEHVEKITRGGSRGARGRRTSGERGRGGIGRVAKGGGKARVGAHVRYTIAQHVVQLAGGCQ